VHFFRRLHLQPEKTAQPRASRAFGDGGAVASRLVVGKRDSVHALRERAADDFRRRHFEIGAGTQARVDMEVKLHCGNFTKYAIILHMNIVDIVKTLDGTLVAGGESDREVGAVVANDLMSDVLLNDGEDILLLTSLASDQAIRTANIVGAMCVVVHNSKPLPQTMCQVADTLGIPLVSSPLSKYESCIRVHDFLEAEKK
jgi:hypothetical protein